MTKVNIYLTFNGNCEVAFNFYKSVFGGQFSYIGKYNKMPVQKNLPKIAKSELDNIMHITFPISKETVLMGKDGIKSQGQSVIFGNNFSISVNSDDIEKAEIIFKGLSEGGNITQQLDKTFWGSYFGIVTDKFGINWIINVDLTKKSHN